MSSLESFCADADDEVVVEFLSEEIKLLNASIGMNIYKLMTGENFQLNAVMAS